MSSSDLLLDSLGPFLWIIPAVATAVCVATASIAAAKGQAMLWSTGLVLWFTLAVALARQDVFAASMDGWNFSTDWMGFAAYGTLPVLPIGIFTVLFQTNSAVRKFLVQDIPPWWYVALQVYRLAGGCYLYIYLNGAMHNYTALQTGILDITIGVTALPLAYMIQTPEGLRRYATFLRIWHAVGLYDLASAFALVVANFVGLYDSQPSLAFIAFYPFSLITLYQVSIAMAIHLLFLTQLPEMTAAATRYAAVPNVVIE